MSQFGMYAKIIAKPRQRDALVEILLEASRVMMPLPEDEEITSHLDLVDELLAELNEVRATQRLHRAFFGRNYHDGNLVFCKENGVPPNNEVILDDMRRVLKRAGLPGRIRFHDLRHSVATFLFAQGEAIKVVSEQLGHSNAATTLNVYAHVLPGGRRAAIEKMAALLRGNSDPSAHP